MKRLLGFWPLLTLILALAFFLRIYRVADTPHDLYVDEVAIGWNAYSILKTGRDEYGTRLPLFFRSYDDYKLPVYIYATTLSEAILGKTAFAVRFPAVLFGTLTVLVFILLVKLLTGSQKLALLTGLLLAISPVSLQFTRAGYEAGMAVFWTVLGVYLMLLDLENKKKTFFWGVTCLVISLYTYHFSRIVAPLLFSGILYWYRARLRQIIQRKSARVTALFLILVTLPFIVYAVSPGGLARARSESFLKEIPAHIGKSLTTSLGWDIDHWLKNYLAHFSFNFLFFAGDGIGRHGVREIGELYLWQLPFLAIGLIGTIRRRTKPNQLFLFWLLVSPVAASLATPSPHAVRSLPMIVPLIYFTAAGIIKYISFVSRHSGKRIRQLAESESRIHLSAQVEILESSSDQTRVIFRRMGTLTITTIIAYFLLSYLHIYYVHYPNRTSPDWSGGYKEALDFVFAHENQYEKVALTRSLSNGYAYVYFYGQFDPSRVNISPRPQMGFGKYEFVDVPYTLPKNTLYVAQPTDPSSGRLIAQIKNKSGDVQFYIWEN